MLATRPTTRKDRIMNLSQQIYNQLPNPSEIEDMIGELEHLINPVHGIFADFKSTHDYDKKTWI